MLRLCILATMAFFTSFSSAAVQEVDTSPNPAAEVTTNNLESLVPFVATRRVAIGMTRDQVVVSMLGHPDDKLCNDLWIYWDFRAWGRPPNENYTALLVVFVADRVKLIRLADASATKRLLTQVRTKAVQGRFMPTVKRPEVDIERVSPTADAPRS